MTEVKETEEIGTQTIKFKRTLTKTKSNVANEINLSPEEKINVAIEDEYLKTMDFFDNYVEQSELMKRSIDHKEYNEDLYEMVSRDISPEDLGKAFRENQIKILIKTEEDSFSEGNRDINLYGKESVHDFFSKKGVRKANLTT